MGPTSVAALLMAAVFIASFTDAAGRCPPPSRVVYTRKPCRDNYDCGRLICCPDSGNGKSCTEPDRGYGRLTNRDGYKVNPNYYKYEVQNCYKDKHGKMKCK